VGIASSDIKSTINTVKLSPLILKRTTSLTFKGEANATNLQTRPVNARTMSSEKIKGRRRRSSSLVYTEPPESLEQLSDQAAIINLNAEWVNSKGMKKH